MICLIGLLAVLFGGALIWDAEYGPYKNGGYAHIQLLERLVGLGIIIGGTLLIW